MNSKPKYYLCLSWGCIYKVYPNGKSFIYGTYHSWRECNMVSKDIKEITEEEAFLWVMEHPIKDNILHGMAQNMAFEIQKEIDEEILKELQVY